MILVFLSFVLNDSIVIEQFGVGLAAAIIIDAFVVRTVLVPALMHMLGPRNWWLPRSLKRWLPVVHIDGTGDSAGLSALVVAAEKRERLASLRGGS